jgi:hypothetical protein
VTAHFAWWFAGAILATAVAHGALVKMAFDVNEKLPVNEHFSPWFWGFSGKLGKVLAAHRKFYPKSFIPYLALIAFVGMLSFVFIAAHE